MIRGFDFLLSSASIVLLLPIFIPIVVALRFTGEKEVFYRQRRIGLDGRDFYLLKFATMLKDSPSIGTGTITLKDDPRILPFGKFLRTTKINELPQLFNIFIGDMSIIGPRPLTPENFSFYDSKSQSIINSVPPGLSGIGSVVFRSEEEILGNAKSIEEVYINQIAPYKAALECWYIENRSLWLNLILILETILAVMMPARTRTFFLSEKIPAMPSSLFHLFNNCKK